MVVMTEYAPRTLRITRLAPSKTSSVALLRMPLSLWLRWIESANTLSSTSVSESVRICRWYELSESRCRSSRSSSVLVRLPLCINQMPKGELTKKGCASFGFSDPAVG